MDRRRPLAALLSLTLIAATGSDSLPLREARWIAPEARLEQLSTLQPPCLAVVTEDVLIGRAAFGDPLLLGGQAARAGISCASCHSGGRGNPAFVFPGISGPPGTADVTSSLFSSKRGDGQFNPRAIPDLTYDVPKIEPRHLPDFIRGLIVEEFDGVEPPAAIVAALAAYVRALEPAACLPREWQNIDAELREYAIALNAAVLALDRPVADRPLANAMIRAARSRLGLIADRFAGPSLDIAQKPLVEADVALARLQQRLREGDAQTAITQALRLRAKTIQTWSRPLLRHEAQSLYNPARLAAALSAARTP